MIAYYSCQLSKARGTIPQQRRRHWRLLQQVKEFYPYLFGNFKLVTDHNPLTTLTKLKDVGGWLSRWIMFLQQFNYKLVYKPGSRHTNADALFRIPAGDNEVQINSVTEMFVDVDIYSKQQEDHDIAEATKALQEGEANCPTHSCTKRSGWYFMMEYYSDYPLQDLP